MTALILIAVLIVGALGWLAHLTVTARLMAIDATLKALEAAHTAEAQARRERMAQLLEHRGTGRDALRARLAERLKKTGAVTVLLLALASPAWAQPPNRLAVVQRVAEADPARFACAHVPDRACQWDYITALVCELRREDQRWGLNGRRGSYAPERVSWDAINWLGEGPGRDPRTGRPVTIIDVIAGAGAPGQRPTWGVINAAGDGGWIVPESCPGTTPAPTPVPAPPAPQPEPGPDHQALMTRLGAVEGELKAMRADLSVMASQVADTWTAAQSAAHDAKVGAEAALQVQAWLSAGLQASISARFFGTLTGTVRAPQ